MNINGMFTGTNEEIDDFLIGLLRVIEEDECDCNECYGCTDEDGDICWDNAIREILREEGERAELEINDVIYSGPATIIKWNDGTKTVVKCEPNEEYNQEKGFVMAYMKKLLGEKKFFKELKKWVWKNPRTNFDQKNKERQKAQGKIKEEIPEENVIEKIVKTLSEDFPIAVSMAETAVVDPNFQETKKAEVENVDGTDLATKAIVCCECGNEYNSVEAAVSEAEYCQCPECGVVTKINTNV